MAGRRGKAIEPLADHVLPSSDSRLQRASLSKPIPPDIVPYLFNPQARYSRLTSEHHEASGGLGLGLFILGEIVARHGWVIEFESTSASGTTFCTTLPTDEPSVIVYRVAFRLNFLLLHPLNSA
ncbi:ATP-binding protein [Pseudomonas promysalinigenes]